MVRKLALLIGINYKGTPNELQGCVNDVRNMRTMLEENGWTCTEMVDDGSCSRQMMPERGNILTQMRELVAKSEPGDSLFVHYSGHGTSTFDSGGDEDDKRDEAICPLGGGVIHDDELRRILVDRLPRRTTLTMLLDCCHSGTGVDLRYNYEDVSAFNGDGPIPKKYDPAQWTKKHTRRVEQRASETSGVAVCFSGCRDTQTSADTAIGGKACGAMTFAFLKAWKETKEAGRKAKLSDFMQNLSCTMKCYRYSQLPQMSMSCRESDMLFEKDVAYLQL